MALRFVSLLLCTIFAIGSALALPPPPPPTGECGQNALRQTCGTACAPTCSNPNPGPICVLPCIDGCFCKDGYLKAANGVCVRPDECDSVPHIPIMPPHFNVPPPPPKCGADEEYRTCGSACVPTCAVPLPKPWCTRQCAVGCYCKEGYLRNDQNVCVQAKKCKSAAITLAAINIPLEKVPLERHESKPMIPFGPGPVILPKPNIPGLPWGPGPVIFPTPKNPMLALEPGPVIINENRPASINIPLQKIPISHPPVCPKNEEYNTCGVQLDCLASCKVQIGRAHV